MDPSKQKRSSEESSLTKQKQKEDQQTDQKGHQSKDEQKDIVTSSPNTSTGLFALIFYLFWLVL